jgi:ribosome recycling factor
MSKAIEHFEDQLRGLWGGITPGLIDTVKVDCYGQSTPIKHLASTNFNDNKIVVVPYDPTNLPNINATLKSQGFNSYIFSKTSIVVDIPKFGIGGKEKVISQINKLKEEAKVAIRNIRKKVRQKTILPEEEMKAFEKDLQVLTDDSIAKIDYLAKVKEQNL